MFKDDVNFKDGVSASLESAVVPPRAPCVKCGAETKEHHPVKDDDGVVIELRRICSKANCRTIVSQLLS